MPLANIIDRRKNPHKWLVVEAIIEPTSHDNTIEGADQAEGYDDTQFIGYDERAGLSLLEAFKWADSHPFPTTLYLYDPRTNIDPEKPHRRVRNSP